MKSVVQFYQFIQNISIDVVMGSIAMTYLFAQLCLVDLPPVVYGLLAVCVWLIYTFDHLSDAHKIESLAITRRHRFHQLHYDILFLIWLVLLALGLLVAIFMLPKIIWFWGSFVVGFSALHLLLVHYLGSVKSKLVLKEFGVAWNYSVGIVVAPFAIAEQLEMIHLISFILLFLVVLFNLIMFSYFDYDKDVKNRQRSVAVNWGITSTRYFLYILFGTLSLVSIMSLLFVEVNNIYYYLIICFLFSIGIFYLLMIVLIDHRSNSETYRKIGDAIFLIPFVLMFL
jgi:4-hydroxybenzoate polyprenyltransferase